jgi:hypothetical protein
MTTLTFYPINYTSRSTYRIDGGTLTFENTSRYNSTRYIDTTRLDISAFASGPSDYTTFSLIVKFTDNTEQILLAGRTDERDVGFTIPKKVYDLYDLGLEYENTNPNREVAMVVVTSDSPTNTHYFIVWNTARTSMIASILKSPSVQLST